MKNLGKEATDKITGFKGIVTAKATYLYGCAQYMITPRVDEAGKRQESEWFDEGRLDFHKKVVKPSDVQVEVPACEKREYPSRR